MSTVTYRFFQLIPHPILRNPQLSVIILVTLLNLQVPLIRAVSWQSECHNKGPYKTDIDPVIHKVPYSEKDTFVRCHRHQGYGHFEIPKGTNRCIDILNSRYITFKRPFRNFYRAYTSTNYKIQYIYFDMVPVTGMVVKLIKTHCPQKYDERNKTEPECDTVDHPPLSESSFRNMSSIISAQYFIHKTVIDRMKETFIKSKSYYCALWESAYYFGWLDPTNQRQYVQGTKIVFSPFKVPYRKQITDEYYSETLTVSFHKLKQQPFDPEKLFEKDYDELHYGVVTQVLCGNARARKTWQLRPNDVEILYKHCEDDNLKNRKAYYIKPRRYRSFKTVSLTYCVGLPVEDRLDLRFVFKDEESDKESDVAYVDFEQGTEIEVGAAKVLVFRKHVVLPKTFTIVRYVPTMKRYTFNVTFIGEPSIIGFLKNRIILD